jgi:septal ring factor EnvC (AmiA/AmiB activator)
VAAWQEPAVRRDPRPLAGAGTLIAAGALVAWLLAGSARAGEPTAGAAPADALARQLDAETAVVDRALAAVADKLAAAADTRDKRLRAAYRGLRVMTAASAGGDPMAAARLGAAARLLVERDAVERRLLVEEAAQLRAARSRIAADAARLASIELPGELTSPARGKIVRRFGALLHERSKATLSRRGIDIEVDDHSPVVAPAAGTVSYAGPIRGLDQGVILDHGTYVTVLAKLSDVAVPVGAPISAGDSLGRAARRRVYFEVRVKLGPGGLPIDPEAVLARR